MADYVISISGSAQMMVRDTGGWVEFWFHTGPSSWNNDQQYSFIANNSGSGTRKFRMLRGGNWQFVDAVYVGYDQDISWTIYGSGTGFPTSTQYQHIQRSTPPQPPSLRQASAISSSAFHIVFWDGPDGGSGIFAREIGWSFSPDGPTSSTSSDGDDVIGGFSSGQRVYFWARTQNALGWSGWSNRGEDVTWQVPPPSDPPTFYDLTQTSLGVSFPFTYQGYGPFNEESEFRYGTDPTGVVIDGTFTFDTYVEYLYNLNPGQTYYFWGRARNPVGWGPWSGPFPVTLIAGARVLSGGEWKRAVPYVRVGGIWKVAEPWIKDTGDWKRTSQ